MGGKIKYGTEPTLFPLMSSEEDKTTCIFFSILKLVYPFRNKLLKSIGKSAYRSGNDFEALLHPSFGGKHSKKDIPDGYIKLEQKTTWEALVEVKIKRQDLHIAQLESYLARVKENKFDALITISNELCPQPNMPPLRLKTANKAFRKIQYFHWSWQYILYQAKLVRNEIDEGTERQILSHFIDFLESEKSGASGFKTMPKGWKKFVTMLRDRGTPGQELCDEMISAWFQETADISLQLSDHLSMQVEEIISENSVERRRDEAVSRLKTSGDMYAEFEIMDTRATFSVCLDIDARCLRFSVDHDAPKSAKTPSTQIEHFLKNFFEETDEDEWGGHEDVRLFVFWPHVKIPTDMTMFDAIRDVNDGDLKRSKLINLDKDRLKKLQLCYTPSKVSSKIQSPSGVISLLEDEVVYFVDNYVLV